MKTNTSLPLDCSAFIPRNVDPESWAFVPRVQIESCAVNDLPRLNNVLWWSCKVICFTFESGERFPKTVVTMRSTSPMASIPMSSWRFSPAHAQSSYIVMSNSSVSGKSKTDTQKKPRLPHVGNADFHMSDLQTTGGDDWIFNSKGLAEDQLKIGRWNGLDIALRHGRRNAFRFLEGVGFQFVSTYLPTKFQASCRRSLRRGPGYTYSFHDHATSILTKPPTNWISTKSLNSCLSLTQYQN